MINPQVPYNQLPLLKSRETEGRLDADDPEFLCFRQLEFLNGFLDGFEDDQIDDYLRVIHLSDFRYSLDMEGEPIALHRLMEGYSSENALKDAQLRSVYDYLRWFEEIKSLSIENLAPAYFRHHRKGADHFRERKESTIKSYFTNLTVYTAPQGTSVMAALRNELDSILKNVHEQDSLEKLSTIHFQLRAAAPYNSYNGLVARAYNVIALRLLGLDIDFIPLSSVLARRKEAYQSLIRTSVAENQLKDWNRFMMESLTLAAQRLPIQLRSIRRLKTKLREMLKKYTAYDLPDELTGVLMRSPYIKTAFVQEALGCHRQTAYTYLEHLVKMGVLIQRSSGREKMYLNKELFDILNE